MIDNLRLLRNVIKIAIVKIVVVSAFAGERVSVKSTGFALSAALSKAKQGDTLVLESGNYWGKFVIPPRITLMSKVLHKAVINASGQNRAISMMNGATVYGLSITGAKVGVYSEGIDNSIIGCQIYGNRQSGIMAVANLPMIQDNIIYRNQGSGISLWDTRSRGGVISHNTIVCNDNHGISVGGESEVTITDNIIAFNYKLKIKADEKTKITQEFNDYFFNVEINELLPEGNVSFDPCFKNRAFNNFELSDSSRCINSGSEGSTIGSEIFTNFKN